MVRANEAIAEVLAALNNERDKNKALATRVAALEAAQDYDRRQSEHKSVVIDKLNAALTAAQARVIELEAEARDTLTATH